MLSAEAVDLQNVCVGVINDTGRGVEHLRSPTDPGNLAAGVDWSTLTRAWMGAIVCGVEMEHPEAGRQVQRSQGD